MNKQQQRRHSEYSHTHSLEFYIFIASLVHYYLCVFFHLIFLSQSHWYALATPVCVNELLSFAFRQYYVFDRFRYMQVEAYLRK